MSLDYFADLDRDERAAAKTVDQITTRYFRSVAEGEQEQANDLRQQWVKGAKRVSLVPPTGALWEMIARPRTLPTLSKPM